MVHVTLVEPPSKSKSIIEEESKIIRHYSIQHISVTDQKQKTLALQLTMFPSTSCTRNTWNMVVKEPLKNDGLKSKCYNECSPNVTVRSTACNIQWQIF